MDVKFNFGIRVDIGFDESLPDDSEFVVLIKEKIGERFLFKSSFDGLYKGHWFTYHEEFFGESLLELWTYSSETGMYKIKEHMYNPAGKNVNIELHYENRFEGQKWIQISDEFRKKWSCDLVFTVKEEDIERFSRIFPDEKFVTEQSDGDDFYASYRIGRFKTDEEIEQIIKNKDQFPGWNVWHWWRYSRSFKNPSDWKLLHSEDIAREILGLGTSRKFKYSTIDCNFFKNIQTSNILNEGIE